jgi:hypothetical protein
MHLTVSPDTRALGLHHVRAWRLKGKHSLLDGDGLTADRLASLYAEDDAEVPLGYRQLLADLGYPGTVPAGERLRELTRTRGWRSHGAVVDAVSLATLRHGAGIGLHRLSHEDENLGLAVTRATGRERITPAFSTKSRPVPAGDLIYGVPTADGSVTPFAWLGRRDCDSADHQLAPDSRDAVLIVLGCPGETADHTEGVGTTVAEVLAQYRPDIVLSPIPTVFPEEAASAPGSGAERRVSEATP